VRTSTAATSTTVAVTAAATTAAEAAHLGKTRINLLVRLAENVDKITGLLGVCKGGSAACYNGYDQGCKLTISGEEGDGGTLGASTTSTANTVDVILRVVGIVVVQDVGDVTDILSNRLACKSRWL